MNDLYYIVHCVMFFIYIYIIQLPMAYESPKLRFEVTERRKHELDTRTNFKCCSRKNLRSIFLAAVTLILYMITHIDISPFTFSPQVASTQATYHRSQYTKCEKIW